jgi:outer membrane protein
LKQLASLVALVLLSRAVLAQEPEPLSLEEARAWALAKNGDIVVERESLVAARAGVLRAQAAYEPLLRGDVRLRDRTDPLNTILSGAPAGEAGPHTRSFQTSASLVRLLPTGASVSVSSSLVRDDTNGLLALLTPSWSSSLGAEVRQPLFQNRRIDPARRAIRIARVDRSRAETSLRRVAAETVAAVERAYWTLLAARRDVAIREATLRVAEKQREETRIRIQAGTQAESDLAQTTAEIERRRGDLVASTESRIRAENALRQLITLDPTDPLWDREVVPEDRPQPDRPASVDIPAAVARALDTRPELREMALRLDRQDVEIEWAKDRVRPQVDLLAAYLGRGLAGATNPDALTPFGPPPDLPFLQGGLGRSLGTIGENRFRDASIGLAVSIPIGNGAARQELTIAQAFRRQTAHALEQARQRVALEVRNAAAALTSAAQRIEAARAAREAAEIQLQAEHDRFEGGTSSNFFVLTRQTELAAAQLAELVALTDYRKAETELARASGSLLAERAIEVREDEEGSR